MQDPVAHKPSSPSPALPAPSLFSAFKKVEVPLLKGGPGALPQNSLLSELEGVSEINQPSPALEEAEVRETTLWPHS